MGIAKCDFHLIAFHLYRESNTLFSFYSLSKLKKKRWNFGNADFRRRKRQLAIDAQIIPSFHDVGHCLKISLKDVYCTDQLNAQKQVNLYLFSSFYYIFLLPLLDKEY